jgi:hypothetical protein
VLEPIHVAKRPKVISDRIEVRDSHVEYLLVLALELVQPREVPLFTRGEGERPSRVGLGCLNLDGAQDGRATNC